MKMLIMKCNSVEDRMVGVSGDVFTQTQKQIAVKTISLSIVPPAGTKNYYSGPGTGSMSFTVLKDDPDWQDIEAGEQYEVCVDEEGENDNDN